LSKKIFGLLQPPYNQSQRQTSTSEISWETADGHSILFATPERALTDLLYLYPFYDSAREMTELRLDDYFLHEEMNRDLLLEYSSRIKVKALDKRVKMLLTSYNL
jgi:hypothetical protein